VLEGGEERVQLNQRRAVRADSGFYVAELLRLWEQLGVKFTPS